jgi:hypothetical protein
MFLTAVSRASRVSLVSGLKKKWFRAMLAPKLQPFEKPLLPVFSIKL